MVGEDLPDRVLDGYALFVGRNIAIDEQPRACTAKEFINKVRHGDRFASDSLNSTYLCGALFFSDLRRSLGKQRGK